MNEYVNRKGIRGNISHHHHHRRRRQIDFIIVVVAPAAAVDVYIHIACCLESAKRIKCVGPTHMH
jgi:hypothetical protein